MSQYGRLTTPWVCGIAGALVALAVLFAPVGSWAQDRVLKMVNSVAKTTDPHVARAQAGAFITLNLYDNLYRYQGNPPKLVPWLATGYKVSDDGLTWEYTLREDVKFHDGAPFTADDVVYSFRRALAIKRSPAAVFRQIMGPDDVTAPAPNKVRFVISKPFAPFHAAIPLIAIVNSKLVKSHEKDGDWGENWLSGNEAGSGAYRLVDGSFRPQESMEVEYVADHFMGWHDNPIKKVNVQYLKELSTEVLALLKGTIDISNPRITAEQAKRLEADSDIAVHRDQSMRLFLFTMNNQKPPLNNVHVRRAISYAFNYDGFIEQVLSGVPNRDPVPLPLGMWGYPTDVKGYSFDMEKAKAELEKAKQDGVDLSVPIQYMAISDAEESVQAGLLLQSALRELGLKMEIGKQTFYNLAGLTGKVESSPQIWSHWVSTYFVDPENWVGQMYHSDYHGTWKGSAWYKNPKVDELLAKARSVLDQDQRAKLYKEAIRIVVDDAAAAWVYDSVQIRAVNKRVAGYSFSPVGSGSELRQMYWR